MDYYEKALTLLVKLFIFIFKVIGVVVLIAGTTYFISEIGDALRWIAN